MTENTPSELWSSGEAVGVGVGVGLPEGVLSGFGFNTPAYDPDKSVAPGYCGPPLIAYKAIAL